jgi:hypothetical protein
MKETLVTNTKKAKVAFADEIQQPSTKNPTLTINELKGETNQLSHHHKELHRPTGKCSHLQLGNPKQCPL